MGYSQWDTMGIDPSDIDHKILIHLQIFPIYCIHSIYVYIYIYNYIDPYFPNVKYPMY